MKRLIGLSRMVLLLPVLAVLVARVEAQAVARVEA